MKRIIYIAFMLGLIVACDKVDPYGDNTGSNQSIFKLSGTVEGDSINFQAGENAWLDSYHDTVLGHSHIGCSFVGSSGDISNMKMDFVLNGLLGYNSIMNSIELGNSQTSFDLLLANVENNEVISSSYWIVDDEVLSVNAEVSGIGSHDVEFHFSSEGEEYVLRDKLILGGVETQEPNIAITDLGSNLFKFQMNNSLVVYDSISWTINSGLGDVAYIGSGSVVNYYVQPERHVVECQLFLNGERINYKSKMFSSQSTIAIVNMDNTLTQIANEALQIDSKGQISLTKSQKDYTTLDSYPNYSYTFENVVPFEDPNTGLEMVKGEISIVGHLFASPTDSIKINVSGTIGLKLFP